MNESAGGQRSTGLRAALREFAFGIVQQLFGRIVRDIVDSHQTWQRAVQSYEAAATWKNSFAGTKSLVEPLISRPSAYRATTLFKTFPP